MNRYRIFVVLQTNYNQTPGRIADWSIVVENLEKSKFSDNSRFQLIDLRRWNIHSILLKSVSVYFFCSKYPSEFWYAQRYFQCKVVVNHRLCKLIQRIVCYPSDGVCEPVPMIPYATPNTDLATNGSAVDYQCNPGFAFNGSQSTAVILCNGVTWSDLGNHCKGKWWLRCGIRLLQHEIGRVSKWYCTPRRSQYQPIHKRMGLNNVDSGQQCGNFEHRFTISKNGELDKVRDAITCVNKIGSRQSRSLRAAHKLTKRIFQDYLNILWTNRRFSN